MKSNISLTDVNVRGDLVINQTLEHRAICGGDKSVPADECGCLTAVSVSDLKGLYSEQLDPSEHSTPCCTTGNCKKCNSKFSLKALCRRFGRLVQKAWPFHSVGK